MARFFLAAAAVAVAVVLFVVLSDDEGEPSGTSARTEVVEEDDATGGDGDLAKEPPKPEIPEIEVEGGRPVRGVQELEYESGERVRFRVTSDVAEEVHVHGYDLTMEISPGEPVSFDFSADIEGVFEVELEHSHIQIAELTVKPG